MPDGGLDIEQPGQLLAYLARTGRIAAGERPRIQLLTGGVSNRTVLVERPGGESWVLKQALHKLRVKADWFSSPLRIRREAEGLRWLSRLAPAGAITPLIFEDPEANLLAMAAVPQPHENWKNLLLAGRVDEDHVRQFGALLGAIHGRAWHERETLAQVFDDRSFFESLRIEPYYSFSAEQLPAAGDFLKALIDDTRRARFTLVHGDYSPKNILVHQGRLVLLDHEVIHFGDGAFDAGFALAHLLSKAHHLAARRADFVAAAQEFWNTYRTSVAELPWAAELDARAARHTLACLLARVAGRSPLEYLDDAARARQRAAVLGLMRRPPARMADVIQQFPEAL